jgi:acetyl esterase/lipase
MTGLLTLAASAALIADDEPATYPLWPAGAPGALGKDAGGENNPGDIPTITVFKPEKPNGAAIVICPGGGYGFLATDHEGKQVAEWLNSVGITGVMLKYRLAPKYKHPIMLQDAQRALRTVRSKAKEWGLDPKRVGIIGFSAGGHLASTAGTHFDQGKADADDPIERVSSRPDVLMLGYPVIAIDTEYAHAGSRDNLLGKDPDKALLHSLSNETQVTKDTPPTFLVHTNADNGVVPENSILFALALRRAKVPVELHIFERGQHGLGLGNGAPRYNVAPDPAFGLWPKLAEVWLKNQGF